MSVLKDGTTLHCCIYMIYCAKSDIIMPWEHAHELVFVCLNTTLMKALKCKTLGVYNIQCTANNYTRKNIHGNIHVHMRTNACVYGEVYGNLAKTKL